MGVLHESSATSGDPGMPVLPHEGVVAPFLGGRNALFDALNATVNRANLAANKVSF